jgi:hypothetical protein
VGVICRIGGAAVAFRARGEMVLAVSRRRAICGAWRLSQKAEAEAPERPPPWPSGLGRAAERRAPRDAIGSRGTRRVTRFVDLDRRRSPPSTGC